MLFVISLYSDCLFSAFARTIYPDVAALQRNPWGRPEDMSGIEKEKACVTGLRLKVNTPHGYGTQDDARGLAEGCGVPVCIFTYAGNTDGSHDNIIVVSDFFGGTENPTPHSHCVFLLHTTKEERDAMGDCRGEHLNGDHFDLLEPVGEAPPLAEICSLPVVVTSAPRLEQPKNWPAATVEESFPEHVGEETLAQQFGVTSAGHEEVENGGCDDAVFTSTLQRVVCRNAGSGGVHDEYVSSARGEKCGGYFSALRAESDEDEDDDMGVPDLPDVSSGGGWGGISDVGGEYHDPSASCDGNSDGEGHGREKGDLREDMQSPIQGVVTATSTISRASSAQGVSAPRASTSSSVRTSCPVQGCPNAYTRVSKLKEHIRKKHGSVSLNPCDLWKVSHPKSEGDRRHCMECPAPDCTIPLKMEEVRKHCTTCHDVWCSENRVCFSMSFSSWDEFDAWLKEYEVTHVLSYRPQCKIIPSTTSIVYVCNRHLRNTKLPPPSVPKHRKRSKVPARTKKCPGRLYVSILPNRVTVEVLNLHSHPVGEENMGHTYLSKQMKTHITNDLMSGKSEKQIMEKFHKDLAMQVKRCDCLFMRHCPG